jgi:hypothetical protein
MSDAAPMTNREQLDLLFAVDVRGLAACRVIVATTVLWQSWQWGAAGDRTAVLGVLAGTALLVGARARVAAGLLWAWFAWEIHSGGLMAIGVYVTEVLLLWLMLLPSDAVLSVRPSALPAKSVRSVATTAVLLQAAFVYYSAGVTKNPVEWLWNGTAMWDLVHTSTVRPGPGEFVRRFPAVLSLLSRFTIVLEVVFPVLLFVPRRWLPQLRAAVVPWFVAFHLSLMVLMRIGPISYVSLAFWMLFVPGFVWDAIWPLTAPTPGPSPGDRITNAVSGVTLAGAAFSALLSLPVGFGFGPPYLAVVQDSIPKNGLFQAWYMFNSPAAIRASEADPAKSAARH